MSDTVTWLLELDVADGRADDLKALMAEMSDATRADEPGALLYEWHLSPDGRTCHTLERYADSPAAMTHLGTFGERFAQRFLELLTPTRFTVYGSPSDEVRAAVAGFGAVHLETVAGFHR